VIANAIVCLLYVGGDTMVSCSWSTAGRQSIFITSWPVVYWMYICRNGYKAPPLSWRLRDWSALPHF